MDVHILINMIEMVYPDIKIEPDEDYDDGDCTIYHPHLTKIDYIAEVLLLDFKAKVEELFKLVPFHDNDDPAMDYKKYAVVDINPDYKDSNEYAN